MTQPAVERENEREELLARLRQSRERYLRSLEGVSEPASRVRPAEGCWSILDCAEHVAVAERQMLALWEKTATPGQGDPANDARVLAIGGDRSQKQKAPERAAPTGRFATLVEAVENFKANRDRTVAFVQQTKENLREKAVVHPLVSKLDGCQLLTLMALHAERHAGQIEEIKAHPALRAAG